MKKRNKSEAGVALVTALLLMLVFTLMSLGFYFMVTGEQKIAASDRDNAVAFYGAEAGLEKMSSDLAAFFVSHTSPTPAQISELTTTAYRPLIPGVTFAATGGYTILYSTSTDGSTLASTVKTIGGSGPLAGLQGIVTPFTLQVIAQGPNNTEVKLTREVQEVAVPVFSFGIFSENDLSFFAGPDFNFGGRVHTNGNLFLAEGNGKTLTLADKATAYEEVIRTELSNGWPTSSNYTGTVNVLTTPGSYRALASTEGSVVGGPGSTANANWRTLSLSTYNGNIRTRATGAKMLNLALALAGATPVDMLRRPAAGEDPTGTVGSARFFNQASMRILLSDTAAAITSLPGVTTNAPLPLDASLNTGGTLSTDSCHPPVALSPGYTADNDYMSPAGTSLLGGYIKIEIQLHANPGTWQDVTQEVLSLGISRDVQASGTMSPSGCTNLSIVRLQRERPLQMAAPTLSTASGGSLTGNKTYYYVITALGAWGETLGTEASVTTTSSKKKISLSWTAFSGATGYKIYRGTSSGGETGYISVSGGSTISYSDSGASLTSGAPPTSILTSLSATTTATNFVPINLYDAREGEVRDVTSTNVALNGIMNILEVDVQNLQKWFANTLCSSGTVPTSCSSGALALNNSGYILYVSDRRGNNTDTSHLLIGSATGSETGEYGNEDTINPSVSTGAPNGALDTAEDVNGNGALDTYGAAPHPLAVDSSTGSPWPTFMASMPATNPAFKRITALQGRKNSVVLFRHSVRLVNGSLGNLPPLARANCSAATGGFTVAAENPVYIMGNYNADMTNGFSDGTSSCHVSAAVIGDAVTLLSSNWDDTDGFNSPTSPSGRAAATTWYRTAIISGKNRSFTRPTAYTCPQDFGTDGGTHNFLRYIEDWDGQTLNYRGSIASFYYARQALGIYKCCTTVYSPPSRGYNFDADFLSISLLPPGTPRFTDVNALSFTQAILPTQ